jgi:hypothetical protein
LRKSTRSDSHRSVRPGFALGDASDGCGHDSRTVLRTVPEWLETSLPLIEFALQGKQVRRMRHSFRTQLRSYEEGPRVVNAGYAVPTSRTMATSCRTISAHGEWEGMERRLPGKCSRRSLVVQRRKGIQAKPNLDSVMCLSAAKPRSHIRTAAQFPGCGQSNCGIG